MQRRCLAFLGLLSGLSTGQLLRQATLSFFVLVGDACEVAADPPMPGHRCCCGFRVPSWLRVCSGFGASGCTVCGQAHVHLVGQKAQGWDTNLGIQQPSMSLATLRAGCCYTWL